MQTHTRPLVSPRAAIAGLLSFVLIGAAQALYGPALPGLKETFSLSGSTVGGIISIHNAGALLGVLSSLPLSGHPVTRWRAGSAVMLLAMGALIIGTAHTWPLVLVGAFLIGTAYGALTIGLNSLYAVGFGPRSPAMVNLLNAVFGFGAILGPLLIAFNSTAVRFPFLVLTAIAVLLTPLALTLDDRIPVPIKRNNLQPQPRLLIAFILLLALGIGVEASTVGYAATYLVALGETPTRAAGVTSLFFLLFTLSRLVAIKLSLRFAPQQLVIGGLGAEVILFLLSRNAVLAPVTVALLGATLGIFFPNGFNWFSRVFGASSGTTLLISGALVGAVIVPAIIAWIVSDFGELHIITALSAFAGLTFLTGGLIAISLHCSPID